MHGQRKRRCGCTIVHVIQPKRLRRWRQHGVPAVTGVMHGAHGEIIERLVQLIEGVQQARQEGETRHAAVMDALQPLPLHDTLDRHSRQFKALFDLLKGTALWKIWVRALLYTGAGWGLVLAALYGYFWGLSF
jgi:hypothetical protein